MFTPCVIKKELHTVVGRKQTSRCKLNAAHLLSFVDAVDWLFQNMMIVKYSLQMTASIIVIIYCLKNGYLYFE